MKLPSRRHVGDPVAMRVVTFLGLSGLTALVGVIVLVHHATGYEKIDPSTVTLVAGVSTLAGLIYGSLGSILASTGKGAPQPVTVEQPAGQPVPTKDVAPDVQPVADSEFGHIDVGTALVVLIVALVVLAVLGLI